MKKNDLKKEVKHLQKIIFLKCIECCNCSQSSSNIKEIINCNIPGCPLWIERPIEAKGLYTLIKQLRQKNIEISEANKL